MPEPMIDHEYIGFESLITNLSNPDIRRGNECIAVVNPIWKIFRFSVLGNHQHPVLNPFDVTLLRLTEDDTLNKDELRSLLVQKIVSDTKNS